MAEPNPSQKLRAIAVLIDGDNAQPSLTSEMLAEISKYGRTTIRRIYGDWTTPNMNGWKEKLQENAIQPIQQFRHTIGKNATDSAMIIDAMDILHSGVADGFCIVSSDSDYTRLATRVRERGVFVMGLGQAKTAKSFTNACDVFVFVENLVLIEKSAKPAAGTKSSVPVARKPILSPMAVLPMLQKAVQVCVQDDGWSQLGTVGATLRNLDSSFDHRTFGCSSLRALISRFPDVLELRQVEVNSSYTQVFVRCK